MHVWATATDRKIICPSSTINYLSIAKLGKRNVLIIILQVPGSSIPWHSTLVLQCSTQIKLGCRITHLLLKEKSFIFFGYFNIILHCQKIKSKWFLHFKLILPPHEIFMRQLSNKDCTLFFISLLIAWLGVLSKLRTFAVLIGNIAIVVNYWWNRS